MEPPDPLLVGVPAAESKQTQGDMVVAGGAVRKCGRGACLFCWERQQTGSDASTPSAGVNVRSYTGVLGFGSGD